MYTIIQNRKNPFLLILFIVFLSLLPSTCNAFKSTLTKEHLLKNNASFTGDFDGMVKRRSVRILMPYNRAFFFFDGAQSKGISYEAAMLFEKFINKKLRKKTLRVKVIVIPTPREKLFSWLKKGVGDIAIGNLTITDQRRKVVDFSTPFLSNVSEILVTHKPHPEITKLFDLSGMVIDVRKSSSYYENLQNLNQVLTFAEKAPVKIVTVNDQLEDSDLLEMMNNGLISAIIIDEHKGKLWKKIFKNIYLHPKIQLHSGGQIGWAFRKNSPKLKAIINAFAKNHKAGTLTGNVIFNRYLKNTRYITDSTHGKDIKRFRKMVDLFKKYGKKYQFDYLMLAALAYQESRLDQKLKSSVGAVGVMQILPTTARDKNIGIPDITKIGPNIHAGTKYLHFIANRYFPEDGDIDEFNRAFFTFAAYNAGPAKVAKLRREAKKMGLNPNVWFNNVEVVAAKRIGRETVQYVSNILKYYVAYKMLSDKFHQPAKSAKSKKR